MSCTEGQEVAFQLCTLSLIISPGADEASFQLYSIFDNISMGGWGRVEPPFNCTQSLLISPWVDGGE
jgi:hypothetical protein